ncbi:hypothetical protein [Histidinibacterium lentulum]|uniref:Uncharacterized protein n=1 Tax=Histidinibacterium lentulum TaxID=2480588 RepID=A0A3N2QUX6_9RHOB|nr:hypothetical protein [Histidinibacterium lentulum]ROT99038.1 hypothetical protein EAT49_15570 [Histidinibacterium lentulum]
MSRRDPQGALPGHGALPGLGTLAMPLRDLLRGVTSVAAAAEPSRLLPEPLRSRVHRVFESFGEAGTQFAQPHADHEDIRRAARFVEGTETEAAAAQACARVLVFALDRLRKTRPESGLPVSETLTAMRLQQVSPEARSDRPGAQMLATRPPPAWSEIAGHGGEEADLALFTVFAWLMAARAESLPAEERLLGLAFALTLALREEVLAGPLDRGDLSAKLHNLSRDL